MSRTRDLIERMLGPSMAPAPAAPPTKPTTPTPTKPSKPAPSRPRPDFPDPWRRRRIQPGEEPRPKARKRQWLPDEAYEPEND